MKSERAVMLGLHCDEDGGVPAGTETDAAVLPLGWKIIVHGISAEMKTPHFNVTLQLCTSSGQQESSFKSHSRVNEKSRTGFDIQEFSTIHIH